MAFEISKKLVLRGHQVTVFTTDTLNSQSRIDELVEIVDGIKIFRFKNISNNLASKNFPLAFGMNQALRENIKDFDIVHIHEYRSLQAQFTSHHAKKNNVPYIVQARGSVLPFFEKKCLKYCYDFIWGKKILDYAHKVMALTEEEACQYKQMGVIQEKITIIPNGIDLIHYRNLPKKGHLHEKYQIPRENKIILFFGRIHKIKGINLLLEAYCEVQKTVENATLVIVGPDEGCQKQLKNHAKELSISNKVIFTGPLYGQDKLSAYIDADVYVLPSEYESFSNTVLEAWACGIPVIITDSCALSPMITKEKAGIVVKRDPVELSYAIQRILKENKLKVMINAKGRELIEGDYNIENVVEKIESCYHNIII